MRLRDMYLAALMKGGLNDDALREFDDYLRHKNKSLYDAMADVTVHDRFRYGLSRLGVKTAGYHRLYCRCIG